MPELLRPFPFAYRPFHEGAAAVVRATEIVPALRPVAAAVSFIGCLDSEEGLKKAALLRLLGSRVVKRPLESLPDKSATKIRLALRSGADDLIPEATALRILMAGVLAWEGTRLRPILKSIADAGGLPLFVLGIEEEYGGIKKNEHGILRERLRTLERQFDVWMDENDRLDPKDPVDEVKIAITRRAHYRKGHRVFRERLRSTLFASTLTGFLSKYLPLKRFKKDRSPGSLSDYLMGRPGIRPLEGSCLTTHLLAAHLARRRGRRFQVLHYPGHVNLYDPTSRLVLNLEESMLDVATLGDVREAGVLGPRQGAAPLEGFVGGVLLALGVESIDCGEMREASAFLRAACEVLTDDPNVLLAVSESSLNPTEQRSFLRQALRINPRSSRVLSGLGDLVDGAKKARRVYEEALKLSCENRKREKHIFHSYIGPDDSALIRARLAVVLFESGELEGAEKHLEAVFASKPGMRLAWSVLMNLSAKYQQMGRKRRRYSLLKRCLGPVWRDHNLRRQFEEFLEERRRQG